MHKHILKGDIRSAKNLFDLSVKELGSASTIFDGIS